MVEQYVLTCLRAVLCLIRNPTPKYLQAAQGGFFFPVGLVSHLGHLDRWLAFDFVGLELLRLSVLIRNWRPNRNAASHGVERVPQIHLGDCRGCAEPGERRPP